MTQVRRYSQSPLRALACIALIAGLLWSCATTNYQQLADSHIAHGDWDRAVDVYRQAVKENPFDTELLDKFENTKEQAAHFHYVKGRKWLEKSKLPEALQEFQMALGLDPQKPEHQAALGDALRLKEARRAVHDAKKLQRLGRLDEAMTHYEQAIQLDPNLAEALNGITEVARLQQQRKTIGGSAEPVTLRFQNTRLKQVFEILARTADIDVLFDKDVRDDLVTIFTRDTPFDEALTLILSTNQLFAKRVSDDTLLIIPDTKQKREQYQDLKIRTFYLSNAKAKDMANLLRTVLETKRVYVNEPLNTVVVRDEPAKLTLAEHIIHANDRGHAEVLFDLEVLEVNRTKTKRLGLRFAKQAGAGIFPPGTTGFSNALQSFTFRELVNIGPDSYLFTFPGSFLLDFFKQESDAKTLAAPKLRVLNKEKASINIGDKQPILLSTSNVQPGQPQTGAVATTSTVTSIEFKDTGIKLTVEPTIHLDNQISLRLQIEVTRLGDRVVLQSEPEIAQFRFGTRTADTALSLRDGETVVLAGLMQEEDRKTRESVPGVDNIPILGDVLSNSETTKVTTEVILVITAHIVKSVQPTDLVKQTLWSGTAKRYDTKPLFSPAPSVHSLQSALPTTPSQMDDARSEETPNIGDVTDALEQPRPDRAAPTEPAPAPESPDTEPETPEIKPVRLNLIPPAISTKVGEDVHIDLSAHGMAEVESAQVTVTYNAQIMEFKEALEGPIWQDHGVPPSLNISASTDAGKVVLKMGRQSHAVHGNGSLATLVFTAKAPGNAPLHISESSLLGQHKNPIPVLKQHGRVWIQ